MTGKVVDLGPIEPCPEMDQAHEAVESGDHLLARKHYCRAAQAAVERASQAGPGTPACVKWLFIGDLRAAWGQREAAAALVTD